MIKADRAEVSWDARKKRWQVRIQVGEEVIKRQDKADRDAGDEVLRSLAVETAHTDGYELDPATVAISRA